MTGIVARLRIRLFALVIGLLPGTLVSAADADLVGMQMWEGAVYERERAGHQAARG